MPDINRLPGRVSLALAAFAAFSALTGPAFAGSKAADYLVDQQISEACDGSAGHINPAYVVERDLTGDGKADLVISHEGITCATGRRSGFCGAQACSFYVYVRRGALLKLAEEYLGAQVSVGPGDEPPIFWIAHGGSPQAMRWNGKKFQ